jgi:hypothetical protein
MELYGLGEDEFESTVDAWAKSEVDSLQALEAKALKTTTPRHEVPVFFLDGTLNDYNAQ